MIILNRVFSGEYLEDNLWHEVINFFKSDNGKHYIYTTPHGKVNQNAKSPYGVLLVHSVGAGHLEILGWAKQCKCLLSDEFISSAKDKKERNVFNSAIKKSICQ